MAYGKAILCCLVCVFSFRIAAALTGEEIADKLYQHPDECGDPPNKGIWAPLSAGTPCGSDGDCKFPKQWCSAQTDDPTSTQPKLSCVPLSDNCQKAVGGDETTAAPGEQTTTSASTSAAAEVTTSSSSQATTKATLATTKATTKGGAAPSPGGASPAPGGSTAAPAGGCKNGHPWCCFWAGANQCDQNPVWMRTVCAKACGTCGCKASQAFTCKVKVDAAGCQADAKKPNLVKVPISGGNSGLAGLGLGRGGPAGNPQGGQGGSSVVQVPVGGGGTGLAGQRFGQAGQGFGQAGQGVQGGSNRVSVPISGGGTGPFQGAGNFNGGPGQFGGQQPFGGAGQNQFGQNGFGQQGFGGSPGQAGQSPGSSIITVPVGKK